jgi:hypothetical protein
MVGWVVAPQFQIKGAITQGVYQGIGNKHDSYGQSRIRRWW